MSLPTITEVARATAWPPTIHKGIISIGYVTFPVLRRLSIGKGLTLVAGKIHWQKIAEEGGLGAQFTETQRLNIDAYFAFFGYQKIYHHNPLIALQFNMLLETDIRYTFLAKAFVIPFKLRTHALRDVAFGLIPFSPEVYADVCRWGEFKENITNIPTDKKNQAAINHAIAEGARMRAKHQPYVFAKNIF